MATEIQVDGEAFTLERVYSDFDRKYGFKSSADYDPEFEKSSDYDVYLDGKLIARVSGSETQTHRHSSTGNYTWSSQSRKTWALDKPNSRTRSAAYHRSRKSALRWIVRHWLDD